MSPVERAFSSIWESNRTMKISHQFQVLPFPEAEQLEVLTVRLPCSKSAVLRRLVYSALAKGSSRLTGVTASDDLQDMIVALRSLGYTITEGHEEVVVKGSGSTFKTGDRAITLSLSGVTARMIAAMAVLRDGSTMIDGSPPLRKRPLKDLTIALKNLGAKVSSDSLPLTITSQGPVS